MRRKLFDAVRIFGAPLCALRFAGGSADPAPTDPAPADPAKTDPAPADPAEEKKFTQADMDNEVTKRLTRAQKKWEREHPAPAAQPQTPTTPAPGASPATPATAAPSQDDSTEKIAKANKRIVATEAKAAALAAGVKTDKVAYVVKLADLDGVDVDEDDGPDTDAIKKAVDKVLKDMPEFKAVPDDGKGGGSGFQIGADGNNQGKPGQAPTQAAPPAATKRWNRFR